MKTIVVTGGTKGIGRAIVEKFQSEDFLVITCSRNAVDLKILASTLPNVITFQADLSKKEDVLAFADFVKTKSTSIEVLVNNTGVFLPGLLMEEEDGVLEKQIETNLYSAYYLTRHLSPMMIEKKDGYIFNMCSTASITAYTNGGSYCISKFALLGMTKVLREEMKEHQIKVTAVMPGATLTASWEGVDLPAERFIKPQDVANSIWSTYKLSNQAVIEEIVIRPQLGDL